MILCSRGKRGRCDIIEYCIVSNAIKRISNVWLEYILLNIENA